MNVMLKRCRKALAVLLAAAMMLQFGVPGWGIAFAELLASNDGYQATPSEAAASPSEAAVPQSYGTVSMPENTASPSEASVPLFTGTASPSEASMLQERTASPSNAALPLKTESRYSRSEGSSDVTNLRVPVLAYDDTSVTLVWDKPENYEDAANYNVYLNGDKIGDARSNFAEHADWANAYMEAFYAYYQTQDIDMVQVDIHTFRAEGLTPDTEYTFTVVAVDADGTELGAGASVTCSTTETPEVFDITDYGAETVEEGYTSYDEDKNSFILKNTKAIQSAIDDCTEGGKVVIPAGIFMSGALYLKSDMTLELEEGAVLFGSPNVDHYDQNYLLYPYSTDTRSWALLNAYSADENGRFENIRIVGKGTVYGNGWKYGSGSSIIGDGYSPYYQDRQKGDPDWSETDLQKYALKGWVAGSSGKVSGSSNFGILAKDAYDKGIEKNLAGKEAYSTRPNLIVLRNVDGVYIEGITAENPAMHTIAVLDSENVVSENVKYITYDANNADGIELGNTQNAMVYNNFFDTGDDAVNFATGMGKGVGDTEQKPSSQIWTFNNFLRECHGGAIAAGSHTGAGIGDMLVEDNVLNHSDMPFRFKSAPVNGGGVYHVLIRDCAVGDAKQVFTLSTTYSDANQSVTVEPADKPAEFYDIDAYHITADTITNNTVNIVADVDYEKPYKTWHTHHDLYFQDITFTNIDKKLAKSSENLVGAEKVAFDNVVMNWNGINKQENDAAASAYKAWGSISCCNDLTFIGTTTQSTASYDAMAKPVWPEDTITVASASDATRSGSGLERRVKLKWPAASDGEQETGSGGITGYIVETWLDDEIIDITAPVNGTTCELGGLSPDMTYLFKVYAVDAPGNKVPGPEYEWTTSGGNDEEVKEPENGKVSFSGIGYTWGTAKFKSAKAADKRIRGYRAYVNGDLAAAVYNYQLKDPDAEYISMTIGRMLEDKNEIYLEAFTDSDQIYEYEDTTVSTTKNYDYLAPVWTDDMLNISSAGGEIKLSWTEPEDESGIYGYRVYADGKPVYTTDGDYFNHVNKLYTTKDTFFTIKGLDLNESHTFRVEAADKWWRALNGTGPFHWTRSGPSANWYGPQSDSLWKSVAFGQSTDLNFSSNVLSDKVGTNFTWPVGLAEPLTMKGKPVQDVVIESRGGKLQAGHDGLTFYYTEVPANKNFSLTADVTIEHMGPENGSKPNLQEGAGLMVRDVNGSPRKDPLEEGYEEYPAASNMVMLEVGAAGKSADADLNLLAAARYGVNSPAGNLKSVKTSSVFVKSVAKADNSYAPEDAVYKTNYYHAQLKLCLKRTDDGFTASYLDNKGNVLQTYTFKDKNVTPNIVAHLDKDTMNVGFFAARNARMTVRNISLVLSDVVKADESPAYVAPDDENASLYVASAAYTNTPAYTIQVLTNQSGTMAVSQNGTVIASSQAVTGGVQFTYPAVIAENEAEFKLSFVPSEGAESGKEKVQTFTVTKEDYGNDLYAAPDGSETASGTKEAPMSIDAAVKRLVPGGTIYMEEGTYEPFSIPLSSSGNKGARKALKALGEVKITGESKIFVLDSDYWDVAGLDVDGRNVTGSRGVMIHGSHNVMKDSLIHNTSSDAGLTITKSRGSRSLWPSHNLVENCEAYENVDGSKINADGFASKSCSGDDNRFVNCVSHDNADDGWDLYNTLSDGPNGRTIIENCVAYNNGNNGFKLGGEGREAAHILRNSVAFHNNLDGITDNFNPGELTVENNTSFDNRRFNIIMRPSPYKTDSDGNLTADGTIVNNVSYRSAAYSANLDKVYDDRIAARAVSNNYLYQNGTNGITSDNFLSLKTADCFTRADGRIMFGDFLRPADGSVIKNAGAGANLPGIHTPEPEPEPAPVPDTPVYPGKDSGEDDSNRDYAFISPAEDTEGKWEQDLNGWRFKKLNGTYPKEEWIRNNGKWYYFNQTGYMSTGWVQVSGQWYYMNQDGSMAVGWVNVDNKWYYLTGTGACLLNTTTPDGYRVDEKGAWMEK